jgi:hypothetical protein
VPRDRDGTFEPQIVKKRQRRLTGVDAIVLSLYAKGLTTGEITAHFAEIYGASVSKETVSRITDKVMEEMAEWANRPLDQGRIRSVVANQGRLWWSCHRRMSSAGVRSCRHLRGLSFSSAATASRCAWSHCRRLVVFGASVFVKRRYRSS